MSLFGLWTRRCRRWVLLILAMLAAGDAALFAIALRRSPEGSLEQLLTDCPLSIAAACAFLALTTALISVSAEKGARPGYTLHRLAVTERRAFLIHAAHNTLCYLLLWGVQVAVLLGLCLARRALLPGAWERQTLLLAFCRVPFLHCLLPLGDWYGYPRNVLWFAALGCATARERTKNALSGILTVLTLRVFFLETGNSPLQVLPDMVFALSCIALCVIHPHGLNDETEKEAESDGARA